MLSELFLHLLALLTPASFCILVFASLATKSSFFTGMERELLASQAFIPVAQDPEGGVAVPKSGANPLLDQGTIDHD